MDEFLHVAAAYVPIALRVVGCLLSLAGILIVLIALKEFKAK